ncbi:cytochrome b [Amaricoccus tamworthensis]|uniref:cytochrome b n=1 Tax=Amaricoccus tamworthensis TaxID=57002 RepID=UPI003C7BC23A
MANPTGTFSASARWLHWIMAILVLAMIPAGFIMVREGISPSVQDALFLFHKNVGVLLLLLIVVRILYRWRNPAPPAPLHLPAWQRGVAHVTHGLLYVLLLVMPLAGYIRVKGGGFPIETLDALAVPSLVPRSDALAEVAKSVHYYGGWAIAFLVALHVGAALQHGFIKRDGVLERMLPGRGSGR